MFGVDVRLLVIEHCPNEGAAAVLLRRVLDDVGLNRLPIHTQVVANAAEAALRGFVGSPTFLLNGMDPFGEPDREPALACRLYRTEAGLAGLPAIRAAAPGTQASALRTPGS